MLAKFAVNLSLSADRKQIHLCGIKKRRVRNAIAEGGFFVWGKDRYLASVYKEKKPWIGANIYTPKLNFV